MREFSRLKRGRSYSWPLLLGHITFDGVWGCVIRTYQLPSWLQTSDSCSFSPVLNVLKHCTPQQVAPDASANQGASPYCLTEFLSPNLQAAKVSSKQYKWTQEKLWVPPDGEFWRVQLKKPRQIWQNYSWLMHYLTAVVTVAAPKNPSKKPPIWDSRFSLLPESSPFPSLILLLWYHSRVTEPKSGSTISPGIRGKYTVCLSIFNYTDSLKLHAAQIHDPIFNQ